MSARSDSVPLANSRAELATLEQTNSAIEQTLYDRDVLYNALMARNGRKLAAVFDGMVAKLVFRQLEQHRSLLSVGKVPTPERVLSDTQLQLIESTVAKHLSTGGAKTTNDDSSRCMKQMLMLFALVREPIFRNSLINQPPPPHPYPESAEARAEPPPPRSPLVDPAAFLSFLQEDLLPAYTAIMTGGAQRVVLQDWIAARAVAYMARLPLDAARIDK